MCPFALECCFLAPTKRGRCSRSLAPRSAASGARIPSLVLLLSARCRCHSSDFATMHANVTRLGSRMLPGGSARMSGWEGSATSLLLLFFRRATPVPAAATVLPPSFHELSLLSWSGLRVEDPEACCCASVPADLHEQACYDDLRQGHMKAAPLCLRPCFLFAQVVSCPADLRCSVF